MYILYSYSIITIVHKLYITVKNIKGIILNSIYIYNKKVENMNLNQKAYMVQKIYIL